jgi:hypothetical protein
VTLTNPRCIALTIGPYLCGFLRLCKGDRERKLAHIVETACPRIRRVATDARGTALCAQDTLQPNLYMIPPAVDRLTSL